MMTRSKRRAFTLVELLVVILIILAVSAVALPTVIPALTHRRSKTLERQQQRVIEWMFHPEGRAARRLQGRAAKAAPRPARPRSEAHCRAEHRACGRHREGRDDSQGHTTMTVFDRYDIVSEAESGEVVGKVARG